MKNKFGDMLKVIRVIESCETSGQLRVANRMIQVFKRKWPDDMTKYGYSQESRPMQDSFNLKRDEVERDHA